MRRLLVLPALALAALVAFLPDSALACEGCSHGKDAATSASAEGVPAGNAASCSEGCSPGAADGQHACPHAAAKAGGCGCSGAAKATTAESAAPGASVAPSSVADAE